MSILMDRRNKAAETLAMSANFTVCQFGGLREAVFKSDTRTIKVTVIRAGWSANKVYYPATVLPQIQRFLDTAASKVYIDHNEEGLKGARKMSDWVADVKETEVVDNALYATIYVHEDGPNAWIFDRMLKSPEKFGPSIVGLAKVRNGDVDGIKGKIVEEITFIRSFDVVSEPAAGGEIGAPVMNSAIWDENGAYIVEATSTNLSNYLKSLKDKQAEYEAREKFWMLTRAFTNLIEDCIFSQGDLEFLPVAGRKAIVESSSAEFVVEANKFSFKEPKDDPTGKSKGNEESKKVIQHTGNEEIRMSTLAEFKATQPVLYTALADELRAALREELNTTALDLENKRLLKESEDLTAKLTAVTTKMTKLEEDNKALATKLTAMEIASNDATRKGIIATTLAEAALPEQAVTDVFKCVLEAITFSPADVAGYTTKVKQIVEDRKSVVTPAVPGVYKVSAGNVTVPAKPGSGPSDAEIKEMDDRLCEAVSGV